MDIKTTPFLGDIFRRLVAICLKHGAVPLGRMATALPSNDAEVNRVAGEAIKADKKWEAEQGFLRGWVAHIFHMKVAGDPFKELRGSGWKPSAQMTDPSRYPVRLEVSGSLDAASTARYRKASRIAAQWIKNYTVFDFRSLGSYTRADLDRIASGPDPF